LTFLRFLKVLSLALWIGSIFFFASVVAPALFSILPSRTAAGLVVSRSLANLHWIGLVCALVFLLATLLLALIEGGPTPFHRSDLLIVLMMAITLATHFGVERRMNHLKEDMGIIETIPQTDARRVEFNRLHIWSTRLEGSVFVVGFVLMYFVVKEQSQRDRRY
jgi:hypothetical protein